MGRKKKKGGGWEKTRSVLARFRQKWRRHGKLSAAVIDIAEPMLQGCGEDEDYKQCLIMAVMAWNLSLMPETDREEILRATFLKHDMSKRDFEEYKAGLAMLIEQKMLLYPNDNRVIMDYEIFQDGDEMRLEVAGSIME